MAVGVGWVPEWPHVDCYTQGCWHWQMLPHEGAVALVWTLGLALVFGSFWLHPPIQAGKGGGLLCCVRAVGPPVGLKPSF